MGEAETEWHKMVVIQLFCFTILMIPFLLIFAKFFIRIFKKTNAKLDKIKYTLILIGAGTMLPDFIHRGVEQLGSSSGS